MTVFQDAKNKLATAERRAGGNLLVGDLDDILAELGRDPKEMFREMEFMKQVLVVVSTNEAEEFLETYVVVELMFFSSLSATTRSITHNHTRT